MVIVVCAAMPARAWPPVPAPAAAQKPHPAVVRIMAVEDGGMSLGSGTLIGVSEKHGLVVTNWHVVRDATGPISVVFPDGFMSPAWVLGADRVWDLAALGIRRPNVEPVTLSSSPPRPGQPLSIAGYGRKGSYRAVAGRCTDYFSPGNGQPREWVEVSVPARQGDSGGPIFNDRGELAGVLFGANDMSGITMGSYCGRVRVFLASVNRDFERPSPSPTMIARQPTPLAPAAQSAPLASRDQCTPLAPREVQSTQSTSLASPAGTSSAAISSRPATGDTLRPDISRSETSTLASPPAAITASAQPASSTRADQLKTIFAAIGALALLFHSIRLLGAAVG